MQKWFCILQIDLAFTVIKSIKYKNCPEISELIFYTKSGLLALQDDGKREREIENKGVRSGFKFA